MKRQLAVAVIFALVTFWRGATCLAGDLSGEVAKLRVTIEDLIKRIEMQDQRIATLEKALNPLSDSDSESLAATDSATKQASGHLEGWKNPANWKRIKSGMSHSQVQEILGPPTSTDISSWYYEGYVPGSGGVSGNIYWNSHRVLLIQEPVF